MIDAKLQQSLRERFNPEGSMLRRQQLRMLDILLYVDRVCKEHNVRYWLSSGTLLGAVRHGGFIPWDDDLDIEMLREDYDKFVKVFPNNEDFALQTRRNDKYYLLPFAKIRDMRSVLSEYGNNANYKFRGIFIDIFCLESSPRFAYVGFGVLMHAILMLQKCGRGGFTRAIISLCKWLYYGLVVMLRPLLRLLPGKSLNHLYGCGPRWRSRDAEAIFPLSSVAFEGYEFPAPHDVEAYLRRMFGEYDRLPDLERLRVHVADCKFL
jgi:lipopolysaccharide cholinephosphotransferase